MSNLKLQLVTNHESLDDTPKIKFEVVGKKTRSCRGSELGGCGLGLSPEGSVKRVFLSPAGFYVNGIRSAHATRLDWSLRQSARMPRSYRRPHHAGTWYAGNGPRLATDIQTWLEDVSDTHNDERAQAIIAPLAALPSPVRRNVSFLGTLESTKRECRKEFGGGELLVFLVNAFLCSVRLTTTIQIDACCRLSVPTKHRWVLSGDLHIDETIYDTLKASRLFEVMDLATDEAEHSLELHTPYIEFMLRGKAYKVVPIMVGVLSVEMETAFGKTMKHYLDDPGNLFVISSDFCHWGSRFRYTPYDSSFGPIWRYIEKLDKDSFEAIRTGNPSVFRSYLRETCNTICGRYPISLFLNMMQQCATEFEISFVFYDQSAKCVGEDDSSVSYAAGLVVPKNGSSRT